MKEEGQAPLDLEWRRKGTGTLYRQFRIDWSESVVTGRIVNKTIWLAGNRLYQV
ncbi:hypothetical protein JOD24_001355 [Kroppenstedtia sanguinis]